MVRIIDFESKHQEIFRQLNLEWLRQYNLLESHDIEVLNDPFGTIIDKGGYIFLAEIDDQITGSAGLMKVNNIEFELIKMYVVPEFRQKGISRTLIERCLKKAEELGAKKVILYSNSQLQTAINLYEKYGFKHVEVKDVPFVTADVKMELKF